MDGPSDDASIDEVHPQELGELKCAWEKTRSSLRSALESLTSEPVHHHRSSLAFVQCRSAFRRVVSDFRNVFVIVLRPLLGL